MRVDWEDFEQQYLSLYAMKSVDTQGRLISERPCELRTCYQRDRDRIIYSKSFRRLKQKTQVFIAPLGDHFRTRLTHTLEVSQISRTIARALKLNEDLVEAISLGHDLGHTPFGHAGERSLDRLCGHFCHNQQSLRVVDVLEKLNLTFEVRDGILNHSGDGIPQTLEGKIVHIADRIAYLNHDIDDSLRAGIIAQQDLPQNTVNVLGARHSQRINTMVMDVIQNSYEKNDIIISKHIQDSMDELREFLFAKVYFRAEAVADEVRLDKMISALYDFYLEHAQLLPDYVGDGNIQLAVCDYIAGMTDYFAMREYQKLCT